MIRYRQLLILLTALFLAGCKIALTVPGNGHVATESGTVFCDSGESCTVDVPDISFEETFTAYPDPGYQFIGWTYKPRGLCGGSVQPCYLATSGFAGHDALIALLESDEVFYLEPNFLATDAIRSHQAGDVVVFKGTLDTFQRGGEPQSVAVTVRDVYSDYVFSELGLPALRLTRTITFDESGEKVAYVSGFLQDASGTFVDLEDADGNPYLTTGTADYGLQSVPAPAEPAGSVVIDYYIMYSGHTSGPITEGTRSIERFETTAEAPGDLAYPAYKVVIHDRYEYLVTYAENKRGNAIDRQAELWVAPAKGVIRSFEVTSEYSSTGILERESTLSLEFVKANY